MVGAEGRNRTGMGISPVDFESTASTNFTTSAHLMSFLMNLSSCQVQKCIS